MFFLLTNTITCDKIDRQTQKTKNDNLKKERREMYDVIKRDGKKVSLDLTKISRAIIQAFEACGKSYHQDVIDFLVLKVTADFEPKVIDHTVTVENIQDSVEAVLSRAGYEDVAKWSLCTPS